MITVSNWILIGLVLLPVALSGVFLVIFARQIRITRAIISLQGSQIEGFKDEIQQVASKYERVKELYELHLNKNLEFEKQRNNIWDLYRVAGLQAGNAQGMLMREIQVLLQKLNVSRKKLGEKPERVNTDLQRIVNTYSEEHGSKRPEELVVK